MKKMIATAVIAAMLVLLLSSAVFAAGDTLVILGNSATVKTGEVAIITLTVDQNPGFMGMIFYPVIKDANGNRLNWAWAAELINPDMDFDLDQGKIMMLTADYDCAAVGELMDVSFYVPSGAAPGVYTVVFMVSEGECLNAEFDEVSVSLPTVTIMVTSTAATGCRHQNTTSVPGKDPTCIDDGYTAGIFEKGTTVTLNLTEQTPSGMRFAGWLNNGEIYASANSFELTEHAVLEPSFASTTLTFEDGTVPSNVRSDISEGSLAVTDIHPEKGTSLGTKKLIFTSYCGSDDTVRFDLTDKAEDFNTVVFEADILPYHIGRNSEGVSSGITRTYNENFYLTDLNGNVAFKFSLRHSGAYPTTISYTDKDGASQSESISNLATQWQSFKLKIEYKYISESSVEIKISVNGNVVHTTSCYYDMTKPAIKDVSVLRHSPDLNCGSITFYDNVSFKQVKQ